MKQALPGALKLVKHPDKTSIGRIEAGFDFLGYRFQPASTEQEGPYTLLPSRPTLHRHLDRISALYEEGADPSEVAAYVRRWRIWLGSGLGAVLDAGEYPLFLGLGDEGD